MASRPRFRRHALRSHLLRSGKAASLLVVAWLLVASPAFAAKPATKNWAQHQIKELTRQGILASSPAAFRPDDPLTQGDLKSALDTLAQAQEQGSDGRQVASSGRHTTHRARYTAAFPQRSVTIKELDAALVGYLGLGSSAQRFQAGLVAAGLKPRGHSGTEIVARLLGLRTDHPAGQEGLELLPNQPATRAEAAFSLAQILNLSDWSTQSVLDEATSFTLPALTPWQSRILTTAVSYIGYPYVWGGTSPTSGPDGAPGGFDCSGFVWAVYKLTVYAGEGSLANVLQGRTTYDMSGEVPKSKRIGVKKLQPGDVLFFGNGPKSLPAQVDHTGIYLGNNWFIHSSGQGVTLAPFDWWRAHGFAWARRPLAEAHLTS